MFKKVVSLAMMAVMLPAMGTQLPALAAGEQESEPNVVYTQNFDADGVSVGENAVIASAMPAHSGENYLSLPNADSKWVFNFSVEDAADDANYILSFQAKTGVAKSLYVETTPYVDDRGTLVDWATYCNQNELTYIGNGEGKSYLNTGLTAATGGEWMENRLEFRVPAGCNRLQIHFGASPVRGTTVPNGNPEQEDAYRAIDSITIKKAPYNLIRNGDAECLGWSGTEEAPVKEMPYSTWYSNKAPNLPEAEGNTKIHLSGTGNGTSPYLTQTVYLYPGKYMISYEVQGDNTQGKVQLGFSGLQDGDTAMALKYPFVAVSDNGKLNHTHVGYLTINRAAGYTLQINNSWLGGDYYFDNFKLIPVDTAKGDLKFGTVKRTMDGDGANGNTWNAASNNLLFETVQPKSLVAGETLQAFGLLPNDGVSTEVAVVTATYTVNTETGQKKLAGIQIDNGEAGKGFLGTAVTVPAAEAGESVLVKTMTLDSIGGLKPLGTDFALE